MKYNELIGKLERWKKLSGEENPDIMVVDYHKNYEFPIKSIGQFYDKIGIFINAQ